MEELVFEIDEQLSEIIEEEILQEIELDTENPSKGIQSKRKKRAPRNYINNNDFCNALIDYKEQCRKANEVGKPDPMIPNYIGECFMKLAEGLARRPNFYAYSYKDEMVSDGIENCLQYFRNFNPEKTKNPFAYFTQILWFCFVRRIQKEKKQQYIKYKATENFGILDEDELMELGDGQIKQIEVYDNMYSFIKEFEEKEFKKVTKAKLEKNPSGIEKFLSK